MPVRTSRHNTNRTIRRYKSRFYAFLILAILISLGFGLLVGETHRRFTESDPPLRVWVFDVGQGDAIFIETPDGTQILVDGGRDDTVLRKLGSVMWPWDRSIDALVITHPDADHITGLISVLDRYDVATVYTSGAQANTRIDQRLQQAIDEEGARVVYVGEPDEFSFGEVIFDVIWPERALPGVISKNRNDQSVVLLIRYKRDTLLLTGDAEEASESAFATLAGDVDVLKVGHHGSLSSTTKNFLDIVRPEVAVISVGEHNAYGHPHPAVIQRLKDAGSQIFRTDMDGDILLQTSGSDWKVRSAPLPF